MQGFSLEDHLWQEGPPMGPRWSRGHPWQQKPTVYGPGGRIWEPIHGMTVRWAGCGQYDNGWYNQIL